MQSVLPFPTRTLAFRVNSDKFGSLSPYNVTNSRNCSNLKARWIFFVLRVSRAKAFYYPYLLSLHLHLNTSRTELEHCRFLANEAIASYPPHTGITLNRSRICMKMNVQMFGFVFNIFIPGDLSNIFCWFTTSRIGFTDQTRATPNNSITKVSEYFIRDGPHYE